MKTSMLLLFQAYKLTSCLELLPPPRPPLPPRPLPLPLLDSLVRSSCSMSPGASCDAKTGLLEDAYYRRRERRGLTSSSLSVASSSSPLAERTRLLGVAPCNQSVVKPSQAITLCIGRRAVTFSSATLASNSFMRSFGTRLPRPISMPSASFASRSMCLLADMVSLSIRVVMSSWKHRHHTQLHRLRKYSSCERR